MGKAKAPPTPKITTPIPAAPADPSANDQAKAAAGSAAINVKNRNMSGLNNTLATAPEGTLGAAPTNKPELKSTLG